MGTMFALWMVMVLVLLALAMLVLKRNHPEPEPTLPLHESTHLPFPYGTPINPVIGHNDDLRPTIWGD